MLNIYGLNIAVFLMSYCFLSVAYKYFTFCKKIIVLYNNSFNFSEVCLLSTRKEFSVKSPWTTFPLVARSTKLCVSFKLSNILTNMERCVPPTGNLVKIRFVYAAYKRLGCNEVINNFVADYSWSKRQGEIFSKNLRKQGRKEKKQKWIINFFLTFTSHCFCVCFGLTSVAVAIQI